MAVGLTGGGHVADVEHPPHEPALEILFESGDDELQGGFMCSPATCQRCGKVTWTGCGAHVDEVMAAVPLDRRCGCPA